MKVSIHFEAVIVVIGGQIQQHFRCYLVISVFLQYHEICVRCIHMWFYF